MNDVYLVPCMECGREIPVLLSWGLAVAWFQPCHWCLHQTLPVRRAA